MMVRRVVTGCLTAGLFLVGSITASAATRVALLSGEGGEQIASVVDLAQVRLSGEPELELLDRVHIRRVVEEQKLSVSGVVDASQAIAVGKLLAVDLIAVVESSPGKDGVPGIVIFDSRTGIRYWDAALSATAIELEPAADAVVTAVRTAHRKRDGRTKAFQTVGVMTVRNADLPRSQDSLCETVGLLVERGLCRSPDLAVLERKRLAHVNAERLLPVADPPQELLASLTTVDLEVSRAADGRGLKATALVKAAGKEPAENVTVTVPESNAALLAETLLKKLIEALHAAPAVATADPRLEARRFDSEAAHHYSHQRYADAVRAGDAARALDPDNEDYGERLSLYLVRYATYLFWPDRLNFVMGGERAWMDAKVDAPVLETLLTDASRAVEINSRLTRQSAHWVTFNWPLGYLCNRLQGLRRASPPQTRERIDVVLEACRRRSVDYIEAWAAKAEAAPKLLDEYTLHVNDELGILAASTIDTEQYADLMYPILDRWLAVTKGWQPQFNRTDGGEGLNMFLNVIVGSVNSLWTFDGNAYTRKMAPLFAVMQRHARPIIRLYGVQGRLGADRLLGKDSEEMCRQRFADEYRALAQAIIIAPEPWDAERARFSVYEAWPNAIPLGKGSREFFRSELIELCHFMVGRHELKYKIVKMALGEIDHRQASELIRLMLPVIDSPKFRETPNEKVQLKSQLVTAEQEILRKHPEWAAAPVELPWSKATKVFEVSQFRELSDLVGQVVLNEVVYGFCLQFEGDHSALRLVRVPLTGGEVTLLAKLDLELPTTDIPRYARPDFVTAVCADQGAIYVATNGAGIAVFPLKDGPPRRIGLEDGLPSNKVTSVGVLDGKVYAGVGEGYLISYDLEARRCDVLASSRRKQKLSPFDDREPFRVPTLIADPLRKRVVFVIGDGLWQLTPADGRMTQVLNLIAVDQGTSGPKLDDFHITWASPLRGDRLLVSNVFRVIEIDLGHDRAKLIHSPETGIFPTMQPHLLVNGSLWSGGSFARLSLEKREHQSLPPPDKGPTPFRAAVCLELVGGGRQILAGDERSLWLLNLNGVELAAGKAPEGLKEIAKQDKPDPSRSKPPNEAATPPAIPLPASPPPKCTVRAVIVTEDNAAFDESQCICYVESRRETYQSGGETLYRPGSGMSGRPWNGLAKVEISPGMISVGVSLKGYAPVAIGLKEVKLNETLDLGTITLKRGFDWKLTIRNEDDQPVANAEITAACRFNDPPAATIPISALPTKIISNSEGEAQWPHAAAEDYTLTLRAPGHQPQRSQPVRATAERAAVIKLLRAHPTSGRVVDENDKPVADARILSLNGSMESLSPAGRELARTAADGRFVLDQLLDDFRHMIRVDLAGKTRLALTNIVAGKSDQVWKLQPLIRLSGKVAGLGPKDVRRFRYDQCVVDEQGRVSGGFFHGEATLDAEGRFRINDLIPGVIRLEGFRKYFEVDLLKTNDDYVLDLTAPIPARPTPPVNVTTPSAFPARESCTVRAAVVTEDNAAVDEAKFVCWVASLGNPYTSNGETRYGSGSGQGGRIRNGLLSERIEPGMISLGISVPGYAPAAVGLKQAKANETVDFGTIALKRGFTWKLAVRNEDNQPVPNAEIAAVCRFGNVPTKLTSNPEGDVRLEHAAEDDYTFTARAPGHQPLRDLKLRGTLGETATISLRRAHPTSGRVVDENDQPVAGARIKMLRDHIEVFYRNERELTKTDADGNFVLDQLADKQLCTLRVDVDDKPRLVLTNVEAGKSEQVWKLLPSLSLSGRIEGTDAGGERSLRFDQHCLSHTGVLSGSFFSGATRVNADGTFKIEGLIPGMVRLSGFRRSLEVDLPKSRDDFVLDLNAPDPSKPNVKAKLEFVHNGQPVPLTGTLKGTVSQLAERRYTSFNQPLKSQATIDILAFAPGKIRLTADAIVGADYCMATQEFDLKAGQTTVAVEMLPAGSIAGILRDKDGQLVADAVVSATAIVNGKEIMVPVARSNDKGEFVVAPVPLNCATTVMARFDRLSARSEAITLKPGEPRPNLHLRLLP